MRLCRACLDLKSESEFYKRSDRGQLRHKCKECEKEKRPTIKRERNRVTKMTTLVDKEKERFFVCNIKWCTQCKAHHPLTAFSLRADNSGKYRSGCRESKNERRRLQKPEHKYIQGLLCCKW